MASVDVLVTVHPEPLAAAGLAGGSEIELRAVVGFPDPDQVRLTFHGPQDRLDALAAALAGGSVTLPGQPAAEAPAREASLPSSRWTKRKRQAESLAKAARKPEPTA